jgi:hypothetical protein
MLILQVLLEVAIRPSPPRCGATVFLLWFAHARLPLVHEVYARARIVCITVVEDPHVTSSAVVALSQD